MISKVLIFLFVFLGGFALIIGAMPAEFIHAGDIYNPTYRDVHIQEQFNINNMVVYDNMGMHNMTFIPYRSVYNGPVPPDWEAGLPTNQFLDVQWMVMGYPYLELLGPVIQLKQVQKNYFLIWSWYTDIDTLAFSVYNGSLIGNYLLKSTIVNNWDSKTNSSRFSARGNQISTNLLIKQTNASRTIGQNWDDHHLNYYISYDVNFTMMSMGAFGIVGQLLTFQSPNLGIPNPWGYFLNQLIAFPLWASIAYVAYKIIAGLIPWMSGGSGD